MVILGAALVVVGAVVDLFALVVVGAVIVALGIVGAMVYGESTASELTRLRLPRRASEIRRRSKR